ncbi:MAG TPA: lipopolysaccharide biosynthesis protein, partial [Cyanobacteria bacterium UBA11049]|nr:lipopolysaccharide biosynthesis protein [Cyanobacteria bacterium UBA11049]
QAQASLRQAESNLRRFKEENKVVALDEEARAAVSVVTDLQRQINATQTGLADAKAQSEVLKKQLGRGLPESKTLSSISQLPAVQDVLKEVQQVESQLANERSRFQENYPTVVSLKNKKANLERLLQARVKKSFGAQSASITSNLQNSGLDQQLTQQYVQSEAKRLGLSSQMSALSSLQAAYKQRLNSLPSLEQKQRELERQLQAAQSTYSLLLQKFEEIRLAENQNIGNARVISAALVPDAPVSSRQFGLLTAILLGLIASGSTVYFLEAIDKSIKTIDDAKKVFGFTLLGVIPALKKSEKISLRDRDLERATPQVIVRESPGSPFSQAYQMLQANLKFLNSDREIKAIVVTSSVPKEGKSTVSANLAVAMAQLGRKVLLVDADMHRPLQHKIWELPNHLGLSNIIVGQIDPRTAIKKITANLHVLTSGVIPPNPMALLDSQRMASLVEVFSANYDYTIIDSPAVNVAADAAILGKMTDGILLVVRPCVVDTAYANRAKEFLEQSGQHILGQVINGFVPDREPYSYYHFSEKYEADEGVVATENSYPLRTGKNI